MNTITPPHKEFARRDPGRLAASTGMLAGFGGYALVALIVTLVPSPRELGVPGLLLVAAAVGWRTVPLAAAATGLMGWLFYSGFITHTHAHLGVSGITDLVVATTLLVVALIASVAGFRYRVRDRSRPGSGRWTSSAGS